MVGVYLRQIGTSGACGIHRIMAGKSITRSSLLPGSLTYLRWLTLGAFAIGTEGFMIAGLLPALARDLHVGLPAAGNLVTAFSLAYAIGAPVMAVLTAGLERRRLLAVAMGRFTLANLLAALAPGYAGLLAARLLLALSAASFMPAASGYAAAAPTASSTAN